MYNSIRDFYYSCLDIVDDFTKGCSSVFSPSYALAGMPQSRDNSRGLDLSRIVCYMGRNRFHKDHENPQHLRQQASQEFTVAKNREELRRKQVPNSVVGEDGKRHHVNRYEANREPNAASAPAVPDPVAPAPVVDPVNETIKAIELSYKK